MGSLTWAETDKSDAELKVLVALYQNGYYSLDSDLTNDEKDQKAVAAFEAEWNIEEDGEVDQIVIDKMLSIGMLSLSDFETRDYTFSKSFYRVGDRGSDVAVLQRALFKSGWLTDDSMINGNFDAATLDAVKAFQQFNELEVDGIVGPATLDIMKNQTLTSLVNEVPVSRGVSRATVGEYLNWWRDVKGKIIDRGTELRIKDIYTGLEYNVMMTFGGNHADVEAMTAADSEIIKQTYGGQFSWGRRPVLVYVDGRVIAASMSAMPHAGRDDKPSEALVYNRSLGYGYGHNLDKIKNNGMDGVCDLHFAGSTRHLDGRQDSKHQAAIRVAAGME
tara:strand:- start:86 stop:1084 length:999 start_codon:yes stop_codon:yes gene_type:complete